MLGKLIKHDFIGSAHSMFLLYLITFASFGITAIAFTFDIAFLEVIAMIAALIIISFLEFATVIGIMNYFNKSLYSDRGYLSYTLPVKSKNILISKAIVSFTWILFSYLVLIGYVVGLFYYFKLKFAETFGDSFDLILDELSRAFELPTLKEIVLTIVFTLITIFLLIIAIISMAFFSITLANVKPFNKLGFFGGILAFIALSIVVAVAFILITIYCPMSLFFRGNDVILTFKSVSDASGTFGISGAIFLILDSAGLFVATNSLMSKKINLK